MIKFLIGLLFGMLIGANAFQGYDFRFVLAGFAAILLTVAVLVYCFYSDAIKLREEPPKIYKKV